MIRLFGGIEGVAPFRSGEIMAQYVVLGAPRGTRMGDLRRSADAALNRERRAYGLDPGESWSLGQLWDYPPPLPDEAQVIEADIWGARGRTVGTCRLVWATPEVMEGTA